MHGSQTFSEHKVIIGNSTESVSLISAPSDKVIIAPQLNEVFQIDYQGSLSVVGDSLSPIHEGSGPRLIWVPGLSAFRVGAVNGDQWDAINLGNNTFGAGENVKITGDNSFALGTNLIVAGNSAINIGRDFNTSTDDIFSVGFGQKDFEVVAGEAFVYGALNVHNSLDMQNTSIINVASPVNPNDGVNKNYVDNAVSTGLVFKDDVIDFESDPPVSPSSGDRYIVDENPTGDWVGQEDNIAEWDGTQWVFEIPENGWIVFVINLNSSRIYNGDEWVSLGNPNHNNLVGLQGGDSNDDEFFHLTQAAANSVESNFSSWLLNVQDDITPVLGGNLDGNDFDITNVNFVSIGGNGNNGSLNVLDSNDTLVHNISSNGHSWVNNNGDYTFSVGTDNPNTSYVFEVSGSSLFNNVLTLGDGASTNPNLIVQNSNGVEEHNLDSNGNSRLSQNNNLAIGGTPGVDIPNEKLHVFGNTNISNDLNVGSDTLIVNSTNNRVGINVVSPNVPLQVLGPSEASIGTGIFRFDTNSGTNDSGIKIGALAGVQGSQYAFIQGVRTGTANDGDIVINVQGGNVGVGTDSPTELFHVNGNGLIDDNLNVGGDLEVTNNGDIQQNFDVGNILFVNERIGVGIGSPIHRVHVFENATSTSAYLQITNDTTGNTATDGALFGVTATGDLRINQQENNNLHLATNDINRLTIDGNGNVSIQENLKYSTASSTFTNDGNLGTTHTFDFANTTNYRGVLNDDVTITISNVSNGQPVLIVLHYDGTAQRNISWSGIDTWVGDEVVQGPNTADNPRIITVINDGVSNIAFVAEEELDVGTIEDLNNVDITTPQNHDLLKYNSSTSIWENVSSLPSGYITEHESLINHNNLLNTHNLTTDIDHNQLTNYDIAEHRIINDASTTTTNLWSAQKIQDELDAIEGGAATNLGDLGDVTISTVANNHLLQYNSTSGDWENKIVSHTTLTDIGSNTHAQIDTHISDNSIHFTQANISISASQVTSGTFADARISQSSVTQHQSALTITESQISDLQNYALDSDVVKLTGNQSIGGIKTFNNIIEASGETTLFGISTAIHLTEENSRIHFSPGTTYRYSLGRGWGDNSVFAIYADNIDFTASSIALEVDGDNQNVEVKADFNAVGNITGANLNISNWNTAYSERGSQIAGSNLTWDGSDLNVVIDDASTTTTNLWSAQKIQNELDAIEAGAVSSLNDLSDVTITTVGDNHLLQYNSGTTQWENVAGLNASIITSGTFADARISQSSVTQHESALTITESQISDLQNYALDSDVVKLTGDQTIAGIKTFTDEIVSSGVNSGNGIRAVKGNGDWFVAQVSDDSTSSVFRFKDSAGNDISTITMTGMDGLGAGTIGFLGSNVGFGTASPNSTLDVNGNIEYNTASSVFTNDGNLGTTHTFDFTNVTNYKGTLNDDVTITISNISNGQPVLLVLYHDGTTQRNISWSGIDRWIGDEVVQGPETTNDTKIITIINDGDNVVAFVAEQDLEFSVNDIIGFDTSSVSDNDILQYNSSTSNWENKSDLFVEDTLNLSGFSTKMFLMSDGGITGNGVGYLTIPDNTGFLGYLEVNITSGWNVTRNNGLISKDFEIRFVDTGTISVQTTQVNRVRGAIGDNWHIGEWEHDATNNVFRLPFYQISGSNPINIQVVARHRDKLGGKNFLDAIQVINLVSETHSKEAHNVEINDAPLVVDELGGYPTTVKSTWLQFDRPDGSGNDVQWSLQHAGSSNLRFNHYTNGTLDRRHIFQKDQTIFGNVGTTRVGINKSPDAAYSLDVDGDARIYTASSNTKLFIESGDGTKIPGISIKNGNVDYTLIASADFGAEVRTNSNHDISFKTNGNNTRMKVLGDGDIDILNNLDIGGDLNVGSDALIVDSTNNRVGINVGSPNVPLQTLGPSEASTGLGIFRFDTNSGTNDSGIKIGALAGSQGNQYAFIQGVRTGVANDGDIVINAQGGNVGIGTDSPSYMLDVNGDGYFNDSLAIGDAIASGTKSFAGGFGPTIEATNAGSFAMGVTLGVIRASGTGSFAFAGDESGTIDTIASSTGSWAVGQGVQSTAARAIAFGKNFTNSTQETFAVGFGGIDLEVETGQVNIPNYLEIGNETSGWNTDFATIRTGNSNIHFNIQFDDDVRSLGYRALRFDGAGTSGAIADSNLAFGDVHTTNGITTIGVQGLAVGDVGTPGAGNAHIVGNAEVDGDLVANTYFEVGTDVTSTETLIARIYTGNNTTIYFDVSYEEDLRSSTNKDALTFNGTGGSGAATLSNVAFGTNTTNGYVTAGVLGLAVGDVDMPGAGNAEIAGDFDVGGAKNFKIPHPSPKKKETHYLKHGVYEGPVPGGTIYRYTIDVQGVTNFELPDYFKYLNINTQVWCQPDKHFGQAYGEINGNNLTITANQDGKYHIMILGTRNDAAVQNWKLEGKYK